MVLALTEKALEEFALDEILQGGKLTIVRQHLGAIIVCQDAQGKVIAVHPFTEQEATTLLCLLKNYPHHTPYEVLYATFYNGDLTTERTIERTRKFLYEAMEEGTWDKEIRPLRNVLSRIRQKTKTFGVDILSILETGYILMPVRRSDS